MTINRLLSFQDICDLALQRTGALVSIPLLGKISLLFVFRLNNKSLLNLECLIRRKSIIDWVLREIDAEIATLSHHLSPPSKISVCDIGCGLGLANIALANRFDIRNLVLIDIERTDTVYHDFNNQGAGYASLETAKKVMRDAVPGLPVLTINPMRQDLSAVQQSFDLITSYISCGFHYPADSYVDFFRSRLAPDGEIVLDLRKGQDHARLLEFFAIKTVVNDASGHRRVILRRK